MVRAKFGPQLLRILDKTPNKGLLLDPHRKTADKMFDFFFQSREPIANNPEAPSGAGICPGIPSGLVIEMLVTEAGKYSGVPQMEIVGTRIR